MYNSYLNKYVFHDGLVWKVTHILHSKSDLRIEYMLKYVGDESKISYLTSEQIENVPIIKTKILNRLIV